MDSEWMEQLCLLLGQAVKVVRFEFPYMETIRESGKKRPPDRPQVLKKEWKRVIEEHRDGQHIFIGGKSLGGRIASLVADECKVSGLICLGFPFHAPGKAPGDRITHLETLKTRSLILQGERDSFGNKNEVLSYQLSQSIELRWLNDGDHSFKPRKKSGFDLAGNMDEAAKAIVEFIRTN